MVIQISTYCRLEEKSSSHVRSKDERVQGQLFVDTVIKMFTYCCLEEKSSSRVPSKDERVQGQLFVVTVIKMYTYCCLEEKCSSHVRSKDERVQGQLFVGVGPGLTLQQSHYCAHIGTPIFVFDFRLFRHFVQYIRFYYKKFASLQVCKFASLHLCSILCHSASK